MKAPLRYITALIVFTVLTAFGWFLVVSFATSYEFHKRVPPNPAFKEVQVRHLVSYDSSNTDSPACFANQSSACPSKNCSSSSILHTKQNVLHAATKAKYSSYHVINAKQTYERCDRLEIQIDARDSLNRTKFTGGDFLWVWIHNDELKASSAADEIIDHKNGSYTALVTLFWEGAVEINVTLVHSREAISILRRVRDDNMIPLGAYQGEFKIDNNHKATKPCHISTNMYIYHFPHDANKTVKFCNYTDSKTGFPWYCVKPEHFPCDSYYKHYTQPDKYKKAKVTFKSLMTSYEYGMVIDSLGVIRETPYLSTNVYVKQATHRHSTTQPTCSKDPPSRCVTGLSPRSKSHAGGYYYKDEWISKVCQMHDFTAENGAPITKCLQNMNLHFYGDSTGRQWFEYLVNHLNKSAHIELNTTNKKNGPIFGFDQRNNISLSFLFHGFPFSTGMAKVADIDYVANRLDKINGGPDSIVFISMWAHFWISDLKFYRERLRSVKEALTRLRHRTPGTRVFLKSPNTFVGVGKVYGANLWYVSELDRTLKEEMVGFPDVTVIDVWDMTIGHRTGLNMHPHELIVGQEVSMLLSFLCSEENDITR